MSSTVNMLMARYAFLLMVSRYSTDLQVAVICQETQQCANKGSKEEDRRLVKIDANKRRFERFKKKKKSKLQMFYEERNLTFFKRKLHRAPLNLHLEL